MTRPFTGRVFLPFKPDMLRAIVRKENPKTQTRRTKGLDEINENPDDWEFVRFHNGVAKFCMKGDWVKERRIRSPFGRPGDIIYVKEGWRLWGWDFDSGKVNIQYQTDLSEYGIDTIQQKQCYDPTEDCGWLINHIDKLEKKGYAVRDKVDEDRLTILNHERGYEPSMFMPAEYTRLFLKIEDITCERLWMITNEDAIAEGISYVKDKITDILWYDYVMRAYNVLTTPQLSFLSLWEKINGRESRMKNPHVFVITFSITTKP